MTDVGFIGTGNIGNPMARNLVRAGHQLVVHDRRVSASANLVELGARWADTPKAVAEQCRVLFMSLPGPPEVESVMTGPDGVLEGAGPGTVVFDLSSNSPTGIRALAARARERGVTLLDSPVSGGVGGAEKATLAVMVGGHKPAFDAHRNLLEAIGTNVFYLGDVGAGCTVKLMNNLLALSIGTLLDEALVVGTKAGIPPGTLHHVMSGELGRTAGSRHAAAAGPGILRRRRSHSPLPQRISAWLSVWDASWEFRCRSRRRSNRYTSGRKVPVSATRTRWLRCFSTSRRLG